SLQEEAWMEPVGTQVAGGSSAKGDVYAQKSPSAENRLGQALPSRKRYPTAGAEHHTTKWNHALHRPLQQCSGLHALPSVRNYATSCRGGSRCVRRCDVCVSERKPSSP